MRPHGVSDHFPWREKMRGEDDVLRYLDDAASLGLRVGLEYDLGVAPTLSAATKASLHYLIGAIHSVHIDGRRIAYDTAGQFLKRRDPGPFAGREEFADAELRRRVLERTLELVREGIEDVGIDILGHPTFTPLQALGDPESSYPVDWQERLIALCVESDVALEINESYGVPHTAFLERARRAGARFSVGSDTHFELGPLDRTAVMIEAADLPHERFLEGRRIRVGA
ncbi:hypothetical protein BH18CHL2_BH18CHL2_09680 [soil metagenome]